MINEVFPKAAYHLFEPLAEVHRDYRDALEGCLKDHSNFQMHKIALGDRDGKVEMRLHEDGYSSTVLDMGSHPDFRRRVAVDQYILDEYVRDNGIPPASIIKIDTQGAERIIFKGATNCLEQAKVIFTESWLSRGYGPETPLLTELIELLSASDFVLAEIGYRFYDTSHALYGCDAFFLKRAFLESLQGRMPEESW